MGGRGKCCCGCPGGVIESEPPNVGIAGATPAGDWQGGPCCWEREYTPTTGWQFQISGVRQIAIQTEWIKTYYEYKRPWWAGTWGNVDMPTAAEAEILVCSRGHRVLGESGVEKELIHEERAVVSSKVASIFLKYHKVDISETETPMIRHKFSLYVCYCVSVQFQARTICYLRREWFSLEPGACFPGTEFDNYPDTETVVNNTFNDTPASGLCTPNHCACFNRTFETLPSSITFNMTNSDEPIELYCGCNVGTDFCAEVPASPYYNGLVYAAANPPVSSTVNVGSASAALSIGLRECVFPFTFLGTYTSGVIDCPDLNVTRYDPTQFNTAPASCIRLQTGLYGVNTNSHCTRTTTPTNCQPFDNAPFEDNLCPPEDNISFCPDTPAIARARWYADIYSNTVNVTSSSSVPTPPELICLNPSWTATVMLEEEAPPI